MQLVVGTTGYLVRQEFGSGFVRRSINALEMAIANGAGCEHTNEARGMGLLQLRLHPP